MTPQREQPSSAIDVFAPWAGAEERASRVRIHRARDVAQARATRSKHNRARSVYWLAAQFASDWVFARASNDALNEILAGLSRLFLVAGLIERLEAPDE
jgi:hypothetical protein